MRTRVRAGGLGCALLLLALLPGVTSAEPRPKRPNILWIVAEDIGLHMGCYGNKSVHTPNLDRLASEGALFTRAFTNTPVCSSSRSSFMTGMYPTSIGAHNHRTVPALKKPLPEGVHVFTKYLQDAGYTSALCELQKKDWNFIDPGEAYDTKNWNELKNKQPFICQYQFYETHRPFHACKEHPVDRKSIELPGDTPDCDESREEWGIYLETLNILDRKVGKVLTKLKRDGLEKNTIVAFSGDNGPHLYRGKRFLYEMGIAMPLIIRSPAHFKPGTVVDELVTALDLAPTFISLAGAEVPAYMQGRIFFGPEKQPEPDYIFAVRDRCDDEVDRMRSVRSKRYKYIRNFNPEMPYVESGFRNVDVVRLLIELHEAGELSPVNAGYFRPKPAEEFYDLDADPWELENLISSPDHQHAVAEMREELDKWIVQTDDLGRFPESEEDLAKYREHRQKIIARRKRNRESKQ
jgi:N-sulfoglucosamine sulfohydrolase